MYDSTKPQSGITFSAGRAVVQANFAGLQTYFTRDHVSLDANSDDSGKHKAIRLTEQASASTLVNELGLYAKDTGTQPELFIRPELDGTAVQMTQFTDGAPIAGISGQTFLPGGIIIKWNTVNLTFGEHVYTFATPFPNNCFAIALTNTDPDPARTGTARLPTVTGYTAKVDLTSNWLYIAIGN